MSDNTTTYTTIIDTQVKGTDDIEKLGNTIDAQDKKFVALDKNIKGTTADLNTLATAGKDIQINAEVKGTEDINKLGDAVDGQSKKFKSFNSNIKETGDEVEGQDKKFKSLKSQIRETTVQLQALADAGKSGTKEFKALSDKLDDLGDQQQRVAFQSGQIEDKLAALPGPIGAIGKSFQSAKQSIDTFGKGLAISLGIVGLIISAFLAMKEALSRTEEGQKTLNKISEAFEKILNGLFAILEPIANVFADLITQLLSSEKTMKVLATVAGVLTGTFTALFGILKSIGGFVINNLVNAFQTFIKVGAAAGDVIAGIFTFDWDRIKKGVSAGVDAVKGSFNKFVDNAKETGKGVYKAVVDGVTTGFDAGVTAFTKGSKRLTKAQREAAKKNSEDLKKNQEALQKQIDEYNKGAEASQKSARDKELLENKQKYDELLKQAEKYGVNSTKLTEGYKKKEEAINRKYDKEDIEKNIAKLDELAKDTNFKFQQRIDALNGELAKEKELLDKGLITATEYADNIAKIEADKSAIIKEKRQKDREERLLGIENELAKEGDVFARRIAMVNEKERILVDTAKQAKADALADTTLTEEERVRIVTEADKKINEVTANAASERTQIQRDRYDERISLINEKETQLLSDETLTENQRTAIQIQAEESRKSIRMEQAQDRMLGVETELSDLSTTYDRKQQLINEKEALLLSDASLTENQRTSIQQQASNERINIALAEKEAKAAIQNAELDLVSQGAGLLKEIAGKNKKLQIAAVIVEQAAAIGKIAVNTGIANAKSIAASPLTFGQPWVTINTISGVLSAATAVAAGVKAIQQINSADNGSAPSAGSISNSAPQATPPAPPTIASTQAPTINTSAGQNPTTQIAETIGTAGRNPIKTYVVAQEMSSMQAFDRRTNSAATL